MLNSGSVDLCITFASAKNDKYTEINTGIKRRTGIVMQNNDQLSRFSELHLEQIEKIPLYGPERNVFANNEKLLSIYNKLNIVTFVDIPIHFLDLIRLGGDYMLCIEPSQEDLLKNGLCFRPVTPQMTFPIKILRNKIAEDNIAVDMLMSYFAQFYNNRK
jgi:hypothetical protein